MFEKFIDIIGMGATEFFILCGVSFLGSFITIALGIGGGILVLATMAQILPPAVLIPLHGVVQLGSNVGRAVLMHRDILFSIVPVFLVGTVLGSYLGAKLVISLPTEVLQLVLGLFVIYSVWGPKLKASNPGKKTFFVVGFGASLTTMFVGATGVFVASFVSAACPERHQYVATNATLMTLQHGLKIVAFGVLGFTFGPHIPLLCGLIAFGYAGTWCGKHVLVRVPEKAFRIGLKIILTLLASRLLYDAASSYLN
jgi:uncharacterized membrane protein YfcA